MKNRIFAMMLLFVWGNVNAEENSLALDYLTKHEFVDDFHVSMMSGVDYRDNSFRKFSVEICLDHKCLSFVTYDENMIDRICELSFYYLYISKSRKLSNNTGFMNVLGDLLGKKNVTTYQGNLMSDVFDVMENFLEKNQLEIFKVTYDAEEYYSLLDKKDFLSDLRRKINLKNKYKKPNN